MIYFITTYKRQVFSNLPFFSFEYTYNKYSNISYIISISLFKLNINFEYIIYKFNYKTNKVKVMNKILNFIKNIFNPLANKNWRFIQIKKNIDYSLIEDVRLDKLAIYIKDNDTNEKNISLVDAKEMLGILGRRWRNMTDEEFLTEVLAIYTRAGLNKK